MKVNCAGLRTEMGHSGPGSTVPSHGVNAFSSHSHCSAFCPFNACKPELAKGNKATAATCSREKARH